MKKKKLKIKWKNLFVLLLFVICFTALTISTVNIVQWKIDSNKIKKEISNIDNSIVIKEIEDNENTENVNPPIDQDNPYWNYIKMNLIDVDFSKLKKINKEVKGWIQVNGTNINYPFVQTTNNSYYLNHSFDRSYNQAGWVFLDYRNDIDNLDKNTIIYAHGRTDETMFGSLKNIIKSNWYKNPDNYVIKMSTAKENTLWQVFSVYHIKTTNDYIQSNFSSDEKYQVLLDELKNRSIYRFNVDLNSSDKILTLSTCYNKTEKVVMHAKLVKKTTK